jgi:cytochrome c
MTTRCVFIAAFGLLVSQAFGAAVWGADLAAGATLFKKQCANCHSLTAGFSTIAPDLAGVVGRRAGAVKDYQYSAALRNADFVWTPEQLEQWLQSPHGVAVETEMAFPGLKDAQGCADVVEYLRQRPTK